MGDFDTGHWCPDCKEGLMLNCEGLLICDNCGQEKELV
jgi:hypothetical protein